MLGNYLADTPCLASFEQTIIHNKLTTEFSMIEQIIFGLSCPIFPAKITVPKKLYVLECVSHLDCFVLFWLLLWLN